MNQSVIELAQLLTQALDENFNVSKLIFKTIMKSQKTKKKCISKKLSKMSIVRRDREHKRMNKIKGKMMQKKSQKELKIYNYRVRVCP